MIKDISKEPRSTSFIFQAISIAIQKGNAKCVQETYAESAFEDLDVVQQSAPDLQVAWPAIVAETRVTI